MHQTAMNNGKSFFDAYATGFVSESSKVNVIEIGSQDIDGSLRQVCPAHFDYVGLDFQEAKGVDILLKDPYSLPLESESIDIVVSSSCFEHSEMFWLVFLEILRVLKPSGLFYLNAPSAGSFHRYPADCWRFYPDSGKALIAWARRNGINAAMLESFTQKGGEWQDFVSVFIKNEAMAHRFKNRILNSKSDYENGQLLGSSEISNVSWMCQNDKKLQAISQIVSEQLVVN
jgi:SAM-dependent methyltransferase